MVAELITGLNTDVTISTMHELPLLLLWMQERRAAWIYMYVLGTTEQKYQRSSIHHASRHDGCHEPPSRRAGWGHEARPMQ